MAPLHPAARANRLAPAPLPLTVLAALALIVALRVAREPPAAPATPRPAPASCRIRVCDEVGRPVAKARVLATRAGLMVVAEGLTDAQGELKLVDPELQRGEELWVAAPGHEACRLELDGRREIAAQLAPARRRVTVHVVGDDGRSAGQIRVVGSWRAPHAPQALRQPLAGTTGDDGRLVLERVGQGWVQLEARGDRWLSPGPVSLPPGRTDATLRLLRARPLTVVLCGPGGERVTGVVAMRLPPGRWGEAGDRLPCEAARRFCEGMGLLEATDGHLELTTAPRTPLLLEAHAPGHAPARLLVAPTSSRVHLELDPGVSQHVQVVDPAGAPVEGAALVAGSCEPRELENRVLSTHGDRGRVPAPLRPHVGAVTDRSGRALLRDLPASGTPVAIHHPRLGTTLRTLVPAPEDLQLVADGAGTGGIRGGLPPRLAAGQAVCAVGRFPVAGGVELSSHALWQTHLAEDGTFHLEGLPPGAYDVYARVQELLLVGQVTVAVGKTRLVQLERF